MMLFLIIWIGACLLGAPWWAGLIIAVAFTWECRA
jgi:hypothetical protein